MHRRRSEQELEDVVRSDRRWFSESDLGLRISALVRKHISSARALYLLKWIPEQGEEIVDVLVDAHTIVRVEIPRSRDGEESVRVVSTAGEYAKRRMSRNARRSFERVRRVALSDMT